MDLDKTGIKGQMRAILLKEYCQIKRNRTVMVIIILMPIIQLLVLPHAANYELRKIRMNILDDDMSSTSRELISHFRASTYFQVNQVQGYGNEAIEALRRGNSDLLLEIPKGFEEMRDFDGKAGLKITVDATDAVRAELASVYTQAIISNIGMVCETNALEIRESYWYNPFREYKLFMVPGILAFLVTMIATYLISISIVEEKEIDVFRQLDMTPMQPLLLVIGKIICVWFLCMGVYLIGLLIGWVAYGIFPKGNLLLLTCFVGGYLLSITFSGSVIAYFCHSQSQAMLIAFFFMLIFILTGGLLTPISGMPRLARFLALLNPVRLLIDVMRGIVIKGSTAYEIKSYLITMVSFLICSIVSTILLYRNGLKK